MVQMVNREEKKRKEKKKKEREEKKKRVGDYRVVRKRGFKRVRGEERTVR